MQTHLPCTQQSSSLLPEGIFPRHGSLTVLLPSCRAFRSAGATAAGSGGLQRDIGVHVSQRHGTRLAARATVSVSSDGALEFRGGVQHAHVEQGC